MTLTSIKPGDIVDVDKRGRRFLAFVIAKTQPGGGRVGELTIRPVDRRISYRTARGTEIVGHWARRGRTALPAGAEDLSDAALATTN